MQYCVGARLRLRRHEARVESKGYSGVLFSDCAWCSGCAPRQSGKEMSYHRYSVGAVQFYYCSNNSRTVPFQYRCGHVYIRTRVSCFSFVFGFVFSRHGAVLGRGWTSPAQQNISVKVNLAAAMVSRPCVIDNNTNSAGFPT